MLRRAHEAEEIRAQLPGQSAAYVMLDLRRRGGDVRGFVRSREAWLIATLARFNVKGERREGRVGIWADRGPAPTHPPV